MQGWESLAKESGVPYSTRVNIKTRYSTKDDQNKAMWEYFVTCVPNATWPTLAGKLYRLEETVALKRAKEYFQRQSGKKISTVVINYIYFNQVYVTVFEKVPTSCINLSCGTKYLHGSYIRSTQIITL